MITRKKTHRSVHFAKQRPGVTPLGPRQSGKTTPQHDRDTAMAKSVVAVIAITADRAGQRIDNFLLAKLKNIPKTHIYKILRNGEVRVNKKRIKPEYRLREGDSVRIPPLHTVAATSKLAPKEAAMQALEKRVIYEDDNLLIVNKPSGMASHGGSGINFGVIETLRASRPNADLELVHRLDRGTSGCLMISKKRSALRMLHGLLREGKISKKYLLLVHGKWQGASRNVDLPLLKNHLHGGERMVEVDAESGKETLTKFIPQKVYRDASLLEAVLFTGRTHQIRVHAAQINHPVAGDDKYGDDDFNRMLRAKGLRRLFLQAYALQFKLPGTDKAIKVRTELDPELQAVLDVLT